MAVGSPQDIVEDCKGKILFTSEERYIWTDPVK